MVTDLSYITVTLANVNDMTIVFQCDANLPVQVTAAWEVGNSQNLIITISNTTVALLAIKIKYLQWTNVLDKSIESNTVM